MLFFKGKPIFATGITIASDVRPKASMDGWEYPFSSTIGLSFMRFLDQDTKAAGVPTAVLKSAGRPPMVGLDSLGSVEDQLFAILSTLCETEEVKAQIKPDGWTPPVIPDPTPVAPEV